MKTGIVTIIVSALIYWTLPVSITLFERSSAGQLIAAGEIIPGASLEECVAIKDDSAQPTSKTGQTLSARLINFEILLATYARNNTSNYKLSIYRMDAGAQVLISELAINAAQIKDNSYIGNTFMIPAGLNQICYSLQTGDATSGNAITAWLTSQNEPVIRIKSITNLQDAVKFIAKKNYFDLSAEALSGLFFVYIVTQTAIICVIIGYASGKIKKSSHRKRAGGR